MNTSVNLDFLKTYLGSNYNPLEQNCINDMKKILALLQSIDPSSPDPGLLKELCILIHNELGPDCAALAASPLKADQDMAQNISELVLQLQFGQYTLASAADAFFKNPSDPHSLDQMNDIFADMVNNGDYKSFLDSISGLIQNPFIPPS